MALSILTLTKFNEPNGFDETNQRMWVHGKAVFSGDGGTYAQYGLLPNFTASVASVAGALAAMKDESGQVVQLATYREQQQAPILVTGVTVSGANVTCTCINPPAVSQFVTLSGFTDSKLTPLNGITAQVTTSNAGVSFVVAITATTATTAATSHGQAMIVIGPDDLELHSVAGSGYVYVYNKSFATVQILTGAAAQSPLTEFTAGTTPNGVLNDTIYFTASWVKQ